MMRWIHTVIGLLLMFGFGHLSPYEPITPFGMHIIGIFAGLVYMWSSVGLLWPSLLGLVALGLLDGVAMPKLLASSFGSTTVILIFFAMIFLGVIQHYSVQNYISQWFLTRKIINGKPMVFSFIFLYASYILSSLSASVLPALLFMWSVLYGIFKDVGYKKGERYTSFMVVGVFFASISGQAAKPFTGSALFILSSYEKVAGVPIDYLQYMIYGIILNTVAIITYTLIGKFILKLDISKIANISVDRFLENKLPPMDGRQKILFASLFGFLLVILLPSLLPNSITFVKYLNKIGPWGVTILFVVGLCVCPYEGKPLLNFREIASKYVEWNIYILIAIAVGITSYLTAPETGITPFLLETFTPFTEAFSPIGSIIFVLVFALGITQVANNGVMGAVLMPIVAIFAQTAGVNYAALATLLVFAMHTAMLTPGASPFAAMLYANTEWVDKGTVFKYGLMVLVMSLIVYSVIGIPVMNIIF